MDHNDRSATPSGENPYPSVERITAEEEKARKVKTEPYKARHRRTAP